MNRLRRLTGWQDDLSRYIAESEGREFVWGTFDCALFAADWVRRMTGHDLAAEYRGYKTKRGAMGALKRVAGGGVAAAATRALGPSYETVLLARRGDVVCVHVAGPDGEVVESLGIVDPSGETVVTTGSGGLQRAPIAAATQAWPAG